MIDEPTEIEASDEVAQDAKPATIREARSESGEPVGVEADDADDADDLIGEPFDPDSISIEQRVVPMDTLIRRLKQGSVRLNPNFQRKEVWDDGRRSRLIESIILRIPLPMFYVSADVEGRWDVVDGLQRLSTIRNFILGDENNAKLRLKDLEFLGKRLNGKTFDDIDINSPAYQRMINTIMETEMRFTIINPGTPEEVKRNVFKRLNTGGLPLTAQEIRHALYQGQVTDLLIELVNHKDFIEVTGNSVNDSRMAARELVLYFLAFSIFPRTSYKGNMDVWLSNAMRVINLMPDLSQSKLIKIFGSAEAIPSIDIKTLEQLKERFILAMQRGYAIFGKHAFRKSFSIGEDSRKTPINKALFETWANILSSLSKEDFNIFLRKKDNLLRVYHFIMSGEPNLYQYYSEIDGLNVTYSDSTEYPFEGEVTNPEIIQYIQRLAELVFGKTISDMDEIRCRYIDVSYWQYGNESADDVSANNIANKLGDLLSGRIGKSLDYTISKNASEMDSVINRYNFIKNFLGNFITYAEQEQAA